MNPQTIKRIATWGKFVGILTIISGALSAVSGLFLFVVGAIPGVIVAWLGYLVYKTGEEASKFLHTQEEGHIETVLDMYGKLLKFYGIYFIVTLALGLLFGLGFLALLAVSMS